MRMKPARTPEDAAPRLDVIRRQILRLDRLVNELLDVSRIAAGKLPMVREEVDLAALAQEVVERLADEAKTAGSELTVHAPAAVVGQWDRMRLDQVITNLVTNAMKYGRRRPIEVTVTADAGTAWLRVEDQGIGIAPEHHARVFERFERAVAERAFGGLGLGLWIVARIVGDLGGKVHVESALGAGSTFVVALPREPKPPS